MKKLFILLMSLGCNSALAVPRVTWCNSPSYPGLAVCHDDYNDGPFIATAKDKPIELMSHLNLVNATLYIHNTSEGPLYVQKVGYDYYLIDSENVRSELTCSSRVGFCKWP